MSARIAETQSILAAALVVAASLCAFVSTAHAQDTPVPRQTCTATNVGGNAYDGFVCGGSVIDNCTPGAIYQCQGGGVQDPVDNCVLAEVCATGCLTGPNSTPPTVNTDFPVANDDCFAGTRPLTVSPADPVGGTDVTVTATLSESQNTANGPILNLSGGGVLIPHPFCAVPFRLAPGATTSPASVDFGLPTAVVDVETPVNLHAGISYTDTSGRNRFLVSIPFTVRLQPGGTEPPAPAVKAVTVGPSVIGPGDFAVGDVTLEKFAPARGIRATLTSSHPEVAAIIENNQPFVMGACTTSPGAANIQAAQVVDQDTTVTISATSGAPNETPATTTLLVRATELDLDKVSLNPSSVLAGGSSTGTLTMTRAAPPGGAEVLITSSSSGAIVPTRVIVPAGQISATFTITTRADAAFASSTIGGSYNGGFDASAQLTIWPAGTVQGVSSLSLDPSSVIGPASAAGTVTMKYAPPSQAATVTLSSSNTTVARVPPSLTVPAGATRASFTVSTSEVSGSTASTISAAIDGSVQTANITVKPANPPPASAVLTSYTVDPTRVIAGGSARGTVTLQSAAPSGGVPVNLSSQIPTSASVPASVMVPAGATSANFTITTSPSSRTTTVSLSASLNGTSLFSAITVEEAPASTSLSAVTLNPTTVVGGTSSSGTVTLTAAAPSGGTVVSLSDNSTSASTPASVTVPAGATTATFTVVTTSVPSTQTATVTAALGAATRSATLTITAAGGGGGGGAPGFLSPTANAPDSGGDGNGFQSSAVNAYGDDAAVATDTNSGSGTSTSCTNNRKDRHRFYDFGFAIPADSAVTGIEVRLDARADSTAGSPRMCVELSSDGGATWTAAKATGTLATSLATFTLGGAADTWGRTWTAANLSNASFRLRVTNVASSTSRDFFLDWVAVRPHVSASGPAALNAVSVSPTSVTGGNAATGTVTLTAAAPSGGAVVTLASSNGAAASVPANITVAAGAVSATFAVTTSAAGADTSVTITAGYNGMTRTATLTVTPEPLPASLAGLTVSPTSVTGGTNAQGRVTLSSAAPAGGFAVALSGGSPAATVPASVTVAAGASSATFTITTSAVTASTGVTITASAADVTRTATLTVNPPSQGVTLTVTATGRSGEQVTSSPAGISVNVGSTGSASFASGTSITLSVSDGRDAIWSGACSSGGNKTETCVFTLTANASVSANVQ